MLKRFILSCLPAALAALTLVAGAAADPVPPSAPAAIDAYRRLPYCKLAPDGRHLLKEPCRRPPTRSFEQRRAAEAETVRAGPPSRQAVRQLEQQTENRMPPPGSALTPMPASAYAHGAPLPAAPPAQPHAPTVPVLPPVTPPAVQPLNQCDVAGCRGANGTLYQQGAGNIVLDPSGRLCTRNGAFVQCQ